MPSYINTNTMSLNSQLQLNKSQTAMQTAMERLSSGLRINSAKDDPAGLAIASRMSAQVTGMNQAASNANNAISLTQTADGALGQINTMLGTLRQLAVQSADATNTASDRASLQATAGTLVEQINTIATTTQFNGMNLLDGTFKDQTFQVGANAGQTLKVSVNGAKTSQLGTNDTSALTAQGNSGSIASGDLYINGTAIRSSSASDDLASYPASSKAASAIAKAAAINDSSNVTGVSATADVNVSQGASMLSGQAAVTGGTLKINGVELNISTTGTTASDRAAITDAINNVKGQTGIVAEDSGADATGIKLTADDGRNITIEFGGGLDAGNTGVRGLSEKTLEGSAMTVGASTGSLTINGVSTDMISTTTDASATRKNVAAAINAISDKTGVTAEDTGDDSKGVTLTAADGRHINTSFNQVSGTFDSTTTGVTRAIPSTVATAGAAASAASAEAGSTLTINGASITLSDDLGGGTAAEDMEILAGQINDNTTLQGLGISATVDATGNFSLVSSKGASIDVDTSELVNDTGGNLFATKANFKDVSALTVSTEATAGAAASAASAEAGSTLTINGASITLSDDLGGGTAAEDMEILAGQINDNTTLQGLGISATVDATGGFSLVSSKGVSIDVDTSKLNTVSGAGLFATNANFKDVASFNASGMEETDYGSYTLTSDKTIAVTTGGGATASLSNAGLATGSYSAQTAYTSASVNNGLAMKNDDVKINGVTVGASQAKSDTYSAYASTTSDAEAARLTAASAIAKADAFNQVSDQTGVTATANATTVDGTAMTAGTAGTGTLTINGVNTGTIGVADVASAGTDANRLAAQNRTTIVNAINAIKDQTGVTATDTNDIGQGIQLTAADGRNVNLQFNAGLNSDNTGISAKENVGTQTLTGQAIATADGNGSVDINGVTVNITVDGTSTATAGASVANAINAVKDKTGVTAAYNTTTSAVDLSSEDGVGFTVSNLTQSTGTFTAASTGLKAGLTATADLEVTGKSSTSFGTFTLSSTESFTVDKGTTATLNDTGLSVGSFGGGKSGMSLDNLDISTAAGATAAITAIDNAMKQIDSNRGNLGATQNGLTASISNLQVTSLNLTTAQSRIADADFAAETASLSRAQILQQAGTAMLAQANQSNQGVLSLLR